MEGVDMKSSIKEEEKTKPAKLAHKLVHVAHQS